MAEKALFVLGPKQAANGWTVHTSFLVYVCVPRAETKSGWATWGRSLTNTDVTLRSPSAGWYFRNMFSPAPLMIFSTKLPPLRVVQIQGLTPSTAAVRNRHITIRL